MERHIPSFSHQEFVKAFAAGDFDALEALTTAQNDALRDLYLEFENGRFSTLTAVREVPGVGGIWKHYNVLHRSTRPGVQFQLSFYYERPDGSILPVMHLDINGPEKFVAEYSGSGPELVWDLA